MAKRHDIGYRFSDSSFVDEVLDIVPRKDGNFVHYLDYEKLREALRTALRWHDQVDPFVLTDEALSDYDTDLEEIRGVLKEADNV